MHLGIVLCMKFPYGMVQTLRISELGDRSLTNPAQQCRIREALRLSRRPFSSIVNHGKKRVMRLDATRTTNAVAVPENLLIKLNLQ